MGGDHKCPVCQATFTRPQHVARHMRSHTGDRPYKCQHCGDQFARSDLLSRHVNKCHSAEKDLGHPPLPGVAPGRRKGSSAATRATTSKQACDQCVQGSLPCDGSNPCSKCIARKVRCTFVKFHRQTAPVGPGHPASLAAHPSSSSGSTLEPPPSSSGPSGLPLPSLLPGLALHQPHPALTANSPHPLRLTHPVNEHPAPFLYAQQAAAAGGAYAPASGGYATEYDTRRTYERGRDAEPPCYPQPPGSAGSGAYYGGHGGYYDAFDGSSESGSHFDSDFDGRSERGSSVSGGGSRPQSSAGPPGANYAPYLPNGRHHVSASLDLHQPSHPDMPGGGAPRAGEFSNAFGLMSLDDPNVLAGLATDGVPFFSQPPPPTGGRPHSSHHPHHPKLPPPPPALAYEPQSAYTAAGLPTSGTSREAETRELREFWKAYMRTPLTGPGELGLQTPSANAANAGGGQLGVSPGPGRRLTRVASLPSVKTPESEFVPNYGQGGGGGANLQRAGTMHNADDLRSYEAAVLARKAPELTLRKPVRQQQQRQVGSPPSSSQQHQRQQPQRPQQQAQQFDFGRDTQSSLAGAFGPTGAYGASAGSPRSPFPGTPSSSGTGASGSASDGEDGGGGGGGRPSFKRLASQTLGPAQPKRRRDPPPELGGRLGMQTPMGLGGGVGGYGGASAAGGPGVERPPSVHSYPDRPMIALRHPPPTHGHGHRGRRLSEPASPTASGFVHV